MLVPNENLKDLVELEETAPDLFEPWEDEEADVDDSDDDDFDDPWEHAADDFPEEDADDE